jgi:uncharacterized protein
MLSLQTGGLAGMQGSGNSFGVMARLMLLVVLLVLSPAALALSTPERNGWVTDAAGILDADTASVIATKLVELQRNTGDEVIVVTLSSLQGVSIETWGNVLGESWEVGRSGGHDTGVLLVVAPNDRKVRIAVGYGLGNRISDSVAAAIIADHVLPYFRQGDFAGGVKAGVDSIAVQLVRAPTPTASDIERGAYPVSVQRPSIWTRLHRFFTPSHENKIIAFWILVFVVVFIWMVLNVGNVGGGYRRRRSSDGYYYNDYNDSGWSSSNSGSGWSSGGGSSSSSGSSGSGGGGSFGGGATGSW